MQGPKEHYYLAITFFELKGCIHNVEWNCAGIFSINFTRVFKETSLETSSEVHEAYKNTNQAKKKKMTLNQSNRREPVKING